MVLLHRAALRPGYRVLDIGCGTGTLATLIKRTHPDVEVVELTPTPRLLPAPDAKQRRRRFRSSSIRDLEMTFRTPRRASTVCSRRSFPPLAARPKGQDTACSPERPQAWRRASHARLRGPREWLERCSRPLTSLKPTFEREFREQSLEHYEGVWLCGSAESDAVRTHRLLLGLSEADRGKASCALSR